MGFFEFVDRLIKTFGEFYENNYFFYVIIVGIALVLMTAVLVIISTFFIGSERHLGIPEEKQFVQEKATDFCNSHNSTSWRWVNESEYKFECFNQTEKNLTISDYYISR